MSIHPSASVDPTALIGSDVQIGPFCVVESDVTIGNRCVLEGHVTVKAGSRMGADNHVFEGAVLGGLAQHIHVPERSGRLVIGSGNTIRENATIHRALNAETATVIGDNNLLMVCCHVAHDCQIGNHTILTNNVMLAGHVIVEDRAYMSGAAGAHQFCRIGTLAMVGGQAHMVKDVPPFVTIDGLSSLVVGLNRVGLRRAGYSTDAIGQLKDAYRLIYRSGLTWAEVLKRLKVEFPEGPAARFYSFLSTTTRGIASERRAPRAATIKLHRTPDQQPELRAKAG
ncbi:MAG: acyl-ACP--UDP-N-acetylglucosamine O-acyltransferase [Candidatus Nealsonbacteria bacterium]|nr:acyl-ACP--UDP-N-acetylglucosamine O-acyltransferase [Candidatus Nealsonbacteria bacterium]